jgi:hypothetical protein
MSYIPSQADKIPTFSPETINAAGAARHALTGRLIATAASVLALVDRLVPMLPALLAGLGR